MISVVLEGITQALLPCSWILLVTAMFLGWARPSFRVFGAFAAGVVGFAWLAVSGWLVVPITVSGVVLIGGAGLWWLRRLGPASATMIGSGAASAWQPCVGQHLGSVLNQAQSDPVGALPGLALFVLGVVAVGIGLGWVLGRILNHRLWPERLGAVMISAIGLSMIAGLYPAISSTLVRWSYSLWA